VSMATWAWQTNKFLCMKRHSNETTSEADSAVCSDKADVKKSTRRLLLARACADKIIHFQASARSRVAHQLSLSLVQSISRGINM
jgi:hypothetical protein